MSKEINIINGLPHVASREFNLSVQMGKVPGASIVSIFAENPDIAMANSADVWDFPAEPIYTFSTTAAIDSISSDDAADNQLIVILGLDANFDQVTQTATLNGLSRVPLTTPLIRFTRAFNGNGTVLAGNVYIFENSTLTLGIPDDTENVRGYIASAEGHSLLGAFTIPRNHTGFFLGLTSSISKLPAAANVVFTGKIRTFDGVFRTAIRYSMESTGASHILTPPTAMSSFPPKTDFLGHGDVSSNGTGVSLTFDILLLDNDIFELS